MCRTMNEDLYIQLGLLGLFLASFLAATIIPFSSEAVLSFFLYASYGFWQCIIVATIGNWLGGLTSYYLGRAGNWSMLQKYFRIDYAKIEKWAVKLRPVEKYIAFFSWLPFLGDLLAVTLGFIKSDAPRVAFFMLAGKFLRYLVWSYAMLYFFPL